MRLTGACVAEASSPRADKRRVLAILTCVRRAGTRSYVLVRCADFSLLKTLPFEDGTSRRLRRRRSLVTAGTSRRRSHHRLHIPGVHCCTPVCQGESILRRPMATLPGSSDRDVSTFTSISVSGLSPSGLHSPNIGHTGRSTVIPKNSHYDRLYSGMSPCTTQYTGDVFEHSPLTSVGFQEVHVFVSRQQLVTSVKSGSQYSVHLLINNIRIYAASNLFRSKLINIYYNQIIHGLYIDAPR